jgi:CRISPR-associated endonuclease/helicase Cas3
LYCKFADLIAISRLVHLAGMMGRSVAISSATIPPDLAQGMFRAYMRGLACYNQFFTEAKQCGVVLCDEFKTVAGRIAMGDFQAYKVMHEAFVDKRVQHLEKQVIKRKGIIVDIPEAPDGGSRITQFFEAVKKAAISLHDDNYVMDKRTKKRVSFGLIRLANTSPCVACSLYLLSSECMLPNGYAIRVMTYHSRQILIMRHEQEKYLDAVLKRKYDSSVPVDIQDPVIRRHLDRIEEDNVLFIVVATPIEEIGRDHDFDWAVVEPSSYRSFIQLAGRVLRHRMVYADIIKPNIAVMQYNIKALQGKPQAFTKPGYEVKPYHLRSHDLHDIIDEGAFHKKIDAVLRIRKPVMNGTDKKDVSLLIDLEHMTMEDFNSAEPGPQGLSGWIDEYWWLTALPQTFNRFREGQADRKLIGVYRDGKIHFSMYEDGECIDCGDTLHIKQDTIEYGAERIWLPRTYEDALCRRIPEDDDLPEEELLETLSNKYGEITLPVDSGDETWFYDDQFGIFKKMR